MSAMATNFSRGLPSRARTASAASIFCQSRKVQTSTPRASSSRSSPGRPSLPAPAPMSAAIFPTT